MIIAITILSVLLVITLLISFACIAHILKIQKELIIISNEQSKQNEDIRKLMITQIEIVKVLQHAAQMQDEIDNSIPWSNVKGEA